MSRFFAKQLGGPVISNTLSAVESFINQTKPVLDYFLSMSIDSANAKHLEFIGHIMGFDRPIINTQDFSEALFRFTSTYTVNPEIGFGYLPETSVGGVLDYIGAQFAYLDQEEYRKILKVLGALTSNISVVLIDKICKIYSDNYIIAWTAINDINITMYTSIYKLATCQYVMDLLFESSPRVIIVKGE